MLSFIFTDATETRLSNTMAQDTLIQAGVRTIT